MTSSNDPSLASLTHVPQTALPAILSAWVWINESQGGATGWRLGAVVGIAVEGAVAVGADVGWVAEGRVAGEGAAAGFEVASAGGEGVRPRISGLTSWHLDAGHPRPAQASIANRKSSRRKFILVSTVRTKPGK